MAESQPILAQAAPQGSVEYRDVPGLMGYRVGSDGSVWSRRQGGGGLKPNFHRLTPGTVPNGYKTVGVGDADGKRITRLVHRLVLESFVGPCPDGMETRHLNGVKSDNRLVNLMWGTPIENGDDRKRHGTQPDCRGENNGARKITEDIVREIRARYASGEFQSSIAKSFGMNQASVSLIVRRKLWKHV